MRRMLSTALISTLFLLPLAVTACGGGDDDDEDADPFDTFQECFDEHHKTEGLTTDKAIVTCCLDHPIAGVKPACGNTEDMCETFVNDGLDAASATTTDIETSCADYIDQLSS